MRIDASRVDTCAHDFVIAMITRSALVAETICAEVCTEIQQEITCERQSFDAVLKIKKMH